MIKLAEALWSPQPSLVSRLCQQAGVEYAVGGLPVIDTKVFPAEQPWDYMPLLRLKEDYRASGFELIAIEARPPLNLAKRGLPGRDQEIDTVCRLIENMGKLQVRVWCYEWMTDFNWLRTATAVPGRGGSLVSEFDAAKLADAPPSELGPVSEEKLWETLEYFLRRVLPVAEHAGVRLAMHPDDPPLSPIRGVGRIMRSVDNYQRLLDLVPSESNGITLCQGNFTLMTDDLPSVIRHFGSQKKIFFVHLRDVRGTAESSSRPGTTKARPTWWHAWRRTSRSATRARSGPTTSRRSMATATTTRGIRPMGAFLPLGTSVPSAMRFGIAKWCICISNRRPRNWRHSLR